MALKACIFDLDGTLLDTLEDLATSANSALAACGLPTRSREDIRSFVGNGVRVLMRRALPEETDADTAQKAYEAFLDIYARNKAQTTKPYEGIISMLEALHARGLQLAVLSNKDDAAVAALCAQYFPDIFALTQGMRDGVRPKPAPDTLLSLCARLGVAPDEVIYIGDSEVDVQTARAADMRLIAVTWGFRSRQTLLEAGAQTFAEKPMDVLALV
ncbi:MAG: HAD-IA family hydrolase [Peptococcaceae bacterium]|nr:HAD-IA family hydrolase [Peptococcaceae bacterium]